jgi:Zn-dependent alcohol dehydrogenase
MEIGVGVTSVKPGDHVIPLYIPFPNAANANFTNRAAPISAARSGLPKAKG